MVSSALAFLSSTLVPDDLIKVKALNSSRIFYIQLIIYGALFPVLLLTTRDTRGPVIRARAVEIDSRTVAALMLSSLASSGALNKQNIRAISKTDPIPKSSQSLKSVLYTATSRPFHMLFTEPVVASFTAWSAFCFGIVYACIQSIAQIYEANYDFTDAHCGYVFVFSTCQPTPYHTVISLTILLQASSKYPFSSASFWAYYPATSKTSTTNAPPFAITISRSQNAVSQPPSLSPSSP